MTYTCIYLQLIRIGFDEDASQMDMKNLLQHIVDLRNPSRITLGLRPVLNDGTLPNTYASKQRDPTPAPPPICTGTSKVSTPKSPGKTKKKGQLNALYLILTVFMKQLHAYTYKYMFLWDRRTSLIYHSSVSYRIIIFEMAR